MVNEIWHSSFDPRQFLSRVNLDGLIEHNEAYNQNKVEKGTSPCILCSSVQGPGLLLNDESYLCRDCFKEVSTISYPEKYETARRQYLLAVESRSMAWSEFSRQYSYHKEDNFLLGLAGFSIFFVFASVYVLVATGVLGVTGLIYDAHMRQREDTWLKQKQDWEREYPEPVEPELLQFYDSRAALTNRDKQILRIFNHWPGYPPFWKYLRAVVLNRDKQHCQVTGCPSRVSLHVHHQKPVSQGGQHVPDNLVTLCDFHHALEPDEGHERIWGSIKNRYFTLVSGHERANPVNDGYHQVRPHLRRVHETIQLSDLEELNSFYHFACPECESQNLRFTLHTSQGMLHVQCKECSKSWEGEQQLAEITGPSLAETLIAKANKGIWYPRWDMLANRTDSAFRSLSSQSPSQRKKAKQKAKPKVILDPAPKNPKCPQCGAEMLLYKPGMGRTKKAFWGCSNFKITGCNSTRRYKK